MPAGATLGELRSLAVRKVKIELNNPQQRRTDDAPETCRDLSCLVDRHEDTAFFVVARTSKMSARRAPLPTTPPTTHMRIE